MKPEMWTDGKVVRLTDGANLLFVALLNQADDSGRLKNDPKEIECRAPRFWGRAEELIKELEKVGLVVVFGSASEFLQVSNFNKHQVIDRPRPSEIPSPNNRRTIGEQSAQGKERKGKEGKGVDRGFQPPTPQEVTEYAKTIDYALDGGRFVNHYEAAGWMRGKTKITSWKACVRTWKINQLSNSKKQAVPIPSVPDKRVEKFLQESK